MRRTLLTLLFIIITAQACAAAPYAPKRSWVQTATITYQSTITNVAGSEAYSGPIYRQLGWYDMLMGAGGAVEDSFTKYNPTGTVMPYGLTSTTYPSVSGAGPAYNDSAWIKQWCDSAGVDIHTVLITPSTSVTIQMSSPYGAGQSVTTAAGQVLRFWDFNTYRNMIDLRSPYAWHIIWRKLTRYGLGTSAIMLMEDEGQGIYGGQGDMPGPSFPFPPSDFLAGNYASLGWPSGWTETQIADSLYRILVNNIYPKLDDSLYKYNLRYFKNYAAYFYMTDSTSFHEPFNNPSQYDARFLPNDVEGQTYMGHRRINLLLGEGTYTNCTNWARQWQYLTYLQQQVDSGCSVVFWTGPYFYYNGKSSDASGVDDISTFGKERAFRERYCYYLMAQHPTLTWWLYSSNGFDSHLAAADSIMQRGVVNYNIGQALAKFSNLSAETNPRVYPRLRRRYANAVVLWNFKNAGAFTYDLTQDTATYHCTGFQEVQDDGSLSPTVVLSVNLLDADGKIMAASGGQVVGTIAISNATQVIEGAQLAFQVTTTNLPNGCTITYQTIDGTAIAPGDYTSVTNGQLVIPAGSSTGTIFISTNTDAIPEVTEALSVQLLTTNSGVITTSTATGPIGDGTVVPPQTSTGAREKIRK